MLKRMTAPPLLPKMPAGWEETARAARDVLDYRFKPTGDTAHDSLLETFLHLQVRPFTNESVREHQRQLLKAVTKTGFLWFAAFIALVLGVSVLSIAAAILMGSIWALFGTPPRWLWLVFDSSILLLILGGTVIWFADEKKVRPIPKWVEHRISCYHVPIPLFMIQTAQSIKEKSPAAIVGIEELDVQGQKSSEAFLLVVRSSVTGPTYYLEYSASHDLDAPRVV